MKITSGLGPGGLVLAALMTVGCATQSARPTERLPFHVAVMPVEVKTAQLTTAIEDGSETDLALSFDVDDVDHLAGALLATLEETFCKVTPLSPAVPERSLAANREAWLSEARSKGADVVLQSTLSYQETIRTSLNDRFWLNLPLHALGGPFGWFVSDRSYHFYVRLQAELVDVVATLDGAYGPTDSQVTVLDREVGDASLNFLKRADGVGAWALGMILPAGLVASTSEKVPGELAEASWNELTTLLGQSVRARPNELVRGKLVDFYPRDVHTSTGPDGRYLEGEFVLELGAVSELETCRYRFGATLPYETVEWTSVTLQAPNGRRDGLVRYGFQIPLESGARADSVQLLVTQLDRDANTRSFTFALRPTDDATRP